jgi:hypothetical protein
VPPLRLKRFAVPAFLIIATVRGFLLNFGVYHATRAALCLPFEWSPAIMCEPHHATCARACLASMQCSASPSPALIMREAHHIAARGWLPMRGDSKWMKLAPTPCSWCVQVHHRICDTLRDSHCHHQGSARCRGRCSKQHLHVCHTAGRAQRVSPGCVLLRGMRQDTAWAGLHSGPLRLFLHRGRAECSARWQRAMWLPDDSWSHTHMHPPEKHAIVVRTQVWACFWPTMSWLPPLRYALRAISMYRSCWVRMLFWVACCLSALPSCTRLATYSTRNTCCSH